MSSADILRVAHASLPYAVCDVDDNAIVNIVDGKANHFVATCHAHAAPDLHGNNTAAFIVRACNAHYQMLEALKDISRAIEAKRQIWGRDLSADMRDRMLCCNDKHFRRAEEKVLAAIAAAEAEAGR